MTSTEIYHIYTEIDLIAQEHHLKDALPRLEALKKFVGRMYHEVREEEIEADNDLHESTEEKPTPSDEEFIASDNSVDYDSSDDSSDSETSCCSDGTCQACKPTIISCSKIPCLI